MPHDTNIEPIQAAKAHEALQGARLVAIRHCLASLDPQPGDHALSYADLLARLGVVVEQALAALEEKTDG